MKGSELNQILQIGAKHALYKNDGMWYHHLKKFPGVLFDNQGYVLFITKQEYLNCADLRLGHDLNIPKGISTIPMYKPYTVEQKKIIFFESSSSEEELVRFIRQVGIIKRNYKLVNSIKDLYQNTCQICNVRLQISNAHFYSEVHHIKPLGMPHNGPDILSNMICVCPNCHILLDLGALNLDLRELVALKHEIRKEYILYYKNVLFSNI